MSTTDQVRNALVDLRAIARGNGMRVQTSVERPERRAPVQVRLSVMSSVGGMTIAVRRGDDAVRVIHTMIRDLERANITSRRYEGDP